MNIMNISLAILYHYTIHAAASTCIGNHCCIISSLAINLRIFIDEMSAQVVITIRRPKTGNRLFCTLQPEYLCCDLQATRDVQ